MLHEFLDVHRLPLLERWEQKISERPAPRPASNALKEGIPLFLGQLIETLRLESVHGPADAPRRHMPSELAQSASRHGHELLRDGYAVDQVVYDYGDLCQAITELAMEGGAEVSTREFRTLNRCLDDAIADAVTEFGWQRDRLIADISNRAMSERLGMLAHELRNSLNTAIMSFAVIKTGQVAVVGSTSALLDRSLVALKDLIDRALADVRLTVGVPSPSERIDVAEFVAEVKVAASLEAAAMERTFQVQPVAAGLTIQGDKPMLYSALSNLLQNAFKFTHADGHVHLRAFAAGDKVLFEVEDRCGGLPPGKAEQMFEAFQQHHDDRSGLGLGLSIARRAVVASGGTLAVRDLPGAGCVFTIEMPRLTPS